MSKIITGFLFVFLAYSNVLPNNSRLFTMKYNISKSLIALSFLQRNAILFVGSSSIRKWEDVQRLFPGETVINRGFGGSELTDAIRYANDIIIPYHPRQIIIYSGENDLGLFGYITPAIVLSRFKQLFNIIRSCTAARFQ